MQLLVQLAVGAVNNASAFNGRTIRHIFCPALHVGVLPGIQELGGVIDAAQRHAAKPWPDRHIRNGIFLTRYVTAARQLFVQHVEQAFSFHGEAIDSVLNFYRRVVIEVAKTTAEERGRAL